MNDKQIARLDAEQLVGKFERTTFLNHDPTVIGKLKTEIIRRLNCSDPPDTAVHVAVVARITALEAAAPLLKEWLENEHIAVDSDTIDAMWSLVQAAEGSNTNDSRT